MPPSLTSPTEGAGGNNRHAAFCDADRAASGKFLAISPADADASGASPRTSTARCPAVLRLLGHDVIPGGNQAAVHDQHGVLGEPIAGSSANIGLSWSMMRSAVDLDTPNSKQSFRIGRFVRQ